MIAILQDNKLIFKAIDLLTAAAASAQQLQSPASSTNDVASDNQLVLVNNSHILNNSIDLNGSTSTSALSNDLNEQNNNMIETNNNGSASTNSFNQIKPSKTEPSTSKISIRCQKKKCRVCF